MGCMIFNPHRYTLEEGGRQTVDDRQLAFKREADPKGLLNPGKMIAWDDPGLGYDRDVRLCRGSCKNRAAEGARMTRALVLFAHPCEESFSASAAPARG
jgi:hypothetical protein